MKVVNARSIARATQQAVHGSAVRAASDAAVVDVQIGAAVADVDIAIDAAVSGDLITASPTLAAKFEDIQDQIDALTP